MTERISYSVVVPVHNSSRVLEALVEAIITTFNSVIKSSFEVILVNDSPENKETGLSLSELHTRHPGLVSIIHFDKNYGQFAATICGLKHAKGEYIFTLDDDLQHVPEFIPAFINLKMHAVVIACFEKKKTSLKRQFLSKMKHLVDIFLFNKPKSLYLSSYRMLRRDIVKKIVAQANRPAYFPALLLNSTKDIVNVTVSHSIREAGISGYNLKKTFSLFNLAIKTRFFRQKPTTLYKIKEVINRNA